MKNIFAANDYPKAIETIKTLFAVPEDNRELIIADIQEEIRKGLAGKAGRFKMLPTYMTLPTGNETGYSLAIDMGGTNLRVMVVRLPGKPGTPEIVLSNKVELSRADLAGDAHTLFSVIAREVNKVLLNLEKLKHKPIEKLVDVGFTFSYPVKMINRNSGVIVGLAKELSATGLLGEDPFSLLFKEFAAISGQSKLYPLSALKPAALLNDTVTELIYGAYLKNSENSSYHCRIGGIIGTGYNFAMVLDIKDLPQFNDPGFTADHMIINIEFGNFDAESLPKTIFDKRVDLGSINPGFQQLEKMISGNYLGRITGEVIKELIATDNLFCQKRNIAEKWDNFTCFHMSAIEECIPGNPGKARALMAEIGIEDLTAHELAAIHAISTLVAGRGAWLAGINVGALVQFIDPGLQHCHTIAVDGSVFGKYPGYKEKMLLALKTLFAEKADRISLEYISDGSGIGAAIAAKC